MAKKDYKAIAEAIVANAGGVDNILNASHCMTRLRLQVKDGSKVDQTAAKSKAVEGVINLIVQNGEFQYVIGQDVPSVYEEISKIDGIKAGGTVDDAEATKADMKAAKGGLVNTILSYIGGTFSPIIPIFIAGGLTGAVLSLLRTFAGLDDTNGTVVVLTGIQQAMLWFLPVYIGFSSASRLKSNPYLGAPSYCSREPRLRQRSTRIS